MLRCRGDVRGDLVFFRFFFQAEDGIRDSSVTGVQTCALPIYIAGARRAFGDRAVFIAGRCDDWRRDARTRDADIVLAHGVLHHVDDAEFLRILEFARAALKPDGRFVFYEPCYLIWQSRLCACLMSHDRGQHIRKEQEWKELAGRVFPRVTTSIVTGANLLGYTCIIGECRMA